MPSRFDELVDYVLQDPGAGQPQPQGPFDVMGEAVGTVADAALGRDPAFSQAGVPAFGLRAGLSAADTPAEREAYLTEQVGRGGWTTDRYGNYALTPEGMQSIGLEPGTLPTVIDRPFFAGGPELADIADIRGDIPAIAGGVAGGLIAGGASAPLGIAAAAGGAALGKMIDEVAESVAGRQLQTPAQVMGDVALEAGLGAAGETVYRGVLAPIGRKMLAPHAGRITPEAAEMAAGAQELGIPLKPTSVTRAPLLGTIERIATNVLKEDPVLDSGRQAVSREVTRLERQFGKGNVSREALGELIVSDIRASRKELSRQAEGWFGRVDKLSEGRPIVATDRIKQAAADIMEDFPKGTDGQPLFTGGEGMKGIFSALNDINALPDRITVTDMESVKRTLNDLGDLYNIAPGKGSHYSGVLTDAVEKAYDDVVETGKGAAVNALREARAKYSEEIKKFSNNTIKRVIRDPKLAGSMTNTEIADFVSKGIDPGKISRIRNVVGKDTWGDVQRLTMEKILGNITQRTKDPLEDILVGDKLLTQLDKIGRPSLKAMFGEAATSRLYKLGNAARAVEFKPGNAGQLIAATIAASPLANLGRIMQLKAISGYLSSPTGIKHFTTGLTAKKTRAISSAASRIATDFQIMAESEIPKSQE